MIVLLRPGTGLDFDRYVEKTFSSAETAHRWSNRQYRNVTIRRVEGRYRVGDRIPHGTPTLPL